MPWAAILTVFVYPVSSYADSYLHGVTATFVCSLFLIIALSRRPVPDFSVSRLDIFVFLFFAWYGITYLWHVPDVDFLVFVRWGMFVLFYLYVRSHPNILPVLFSLFTGGCIGALYFVLSRENVCGSFHLWLSGNGCFFNPSVWGMFMTLAFLSGLLFYDRHWKRYYKFIWFLGAAIILAGIIRTGSRTSCLALLAGVLWICSEHSCKSVRQALLTGGVGLCISLIFSGALYTIRPDSVHGRWLVWQVIMHNLSVYSLCGEGILEASYMPLQAEWFLENADPDQQLLAGNTVHAFNELLRIVFESGWIGLGLFALMTLMMVLSLFRGGSFGRRLIALPVAIGISAMSGYPFSSDLLVLPGIFCLASASLHAVPAQRISLHTFTGGYVILILFLWTGFITNRYLLYKKADHQLEQAHKQACPADDPRLAGYADRLWGNADFMLGYGHLLYRCGMYEAALPVLEQGYRLRPLSVALCNLGYCYQFAGRYACAEKAFRKASYMIPSRIYPRYRLFDLYRETGCRDKAKAEAECMLDMKVKVVNTSVLRYRHRARMFLKNEYGQHQLEGHEQI